jgi:hypothetical protein
MIQRGAIQNEAVTFTASGGYQHLASLQYISDGVPIDSSLSYFDGTNYVPVASKFWGFADSQHIWLASEAYSQAKSYYFSYQAINKSTDTFPGTPDVRSIVRIGDRPGVATYTQGSDFLLTTTISMPAPASGNTGTGTITIASASQYTASEPRVYTIAIVASGAVGTATFDWYGNTPSAGSAFNVPTGVDVPLEDGIAISFNGTFAAGDTYTLLATNEGGVTWGIPQTFSESKGSSDIYEDYTGAITGTPYTYYMLLSHIPTGPITVTGSGSAHIPVTQIGSTNYAAFSSYPTGQFPLSVSYPWQGKSPSYGKVYYVSYEYAKDASQYNQVGLVFNESDFYSAVGPASPDNLLALAGQVAFQNSLPFLFFVQIADPDGDGIYTDADYLAGLTATEGKSEITDIVMTSMTSTLRSSLRDSIARMSTSTEKKYRMGWFWMPMNTPSGDTSTPETLVYESRVSMQVTSDSPALGRYILLGNTWATRNFIMGDGTSQTLTTPAWALAAGIAALQDSFQSPSDTLLRQEVPGFTAIDTYTDSEMRYRAGNGLFMLEQLGSLIRVYDTTTTSFLSDDSNEPSAMVQKDAVTKAVTQQLDAAIIGMVPQNTADAVSAIRTQLALVLNALVSDGTIASYEDNLGNPRSLNPFQDIWVDRVTGSRTGFQFKYFFFLRYPVKRLYGTYYVDQNVLFSSGGTPTVTNT